MSRKSITDLMIELKKIIEKEENLSIKQLSEKTKSQWRTAEKALETMKDLEVVVEDKTDMNGRVERLFRMHPKFL